MNYERGCFSSYKKLCATIYVLFRAGYLGSTSMSPRLDSLWNPQPTVPELPRGVFRSTVEESGVQPKRRRRPSAVREVSHGRCSSRGQYRARSGTARLRDVKVRCAEVLCGMLLCIGLNPTWSVRMITDGPIVTCGTLLYLASSKIRSFHRTSRNAPFLTVPLTAKSHSSAF